TRPPTQSKPPAYNGSAKKGSKGGDSPDSVDALRGFSYDSAVAAEAPTRGPPPLLGGMKSYHNPSDSASDHLQAVDHGLPSSQSSKVISAPTNGAIIHNAGAWGNKPATSTREKKRSIWGFRARSSSDLTSQGPDSTNALVQNLADLRD